MRSGCISKACRSRCGPATRPCQNRAGAGIGWDRSTRTGPGRSTRVPAGQWQAARPIVAHSSGDYSLAACMVAPGFDFADFSLMPPDGDEAATLRHHWPDLASLI